MRGNLITRDEMLAIPAFEISNLSPQPHRHYFQLRHVSLSGLAAKGLGSLAADYLWSPHHYCPGAFSVAGKKGVSKRRT